MSKTPSLLPEEERTKEAIAKEEVKKGMALPNFKMHSPEKDAFEKGKVTREQEEESWVNLDFDEKKNEDKEQGGTDEKKDNKAKNKIEFDKGIHTLKNDTIVPKATEKPKKKFSFSFFNKKKKDDKKVESKPKAIKKNELNKSSIKPRENIKPQVQSVQAETDGTLLKMRIPAPEKEFQNGKGKKVLSQAKDTIEEAKTSYSFVDLFKKDKVLDKMKKSSASMNLIFEDYMGVVKAQFWIRFRVLMTIAFAFVIIFSFAFVSIKFMKISLIEEYNEVQDNVKIVEQEIATFNEEGATKSDLFDRAVTLKELLGVHIYWTELLGYLEKNTVENIYYTNMVASEQGRVSMMARGTSYRDIARQLVAFENAEFVEEVNITGGKLNIVEVEKKVADIQKETEVDDLDDELDKDEKNDSDEPELEKKVVVEFIVEIKLKEGALNR